MSMFDLIRDRAPESEDTDDETEVIEDAAEALRESKLIELNPFGYVARIQEQAKKYARAEPSEDTDELTRYLNEVTRNRPPMTKEVAMDAARRGDLSALIEGNLLLVVSVALKWRGYNRSIMDLIGEGNVGLTVAAQRYDVARGFAFSTYGIFYIRNDVRTEALRQDTQYASLPPASRRQLGMLYTARRRMERADGVSVTLRQTAAFLRAVAPDRSALHRRAWPDDGEILAVLTTMGTDYMSTLISDEHRTGAAQRVTIADTLAVDSAYDPIAEIEAKWELEDNAAAWIRDLRAARAHDDLSDEDLHLLCVRYGLPHPDRTWEPPVGWEIGHVHSLRWVAHATKRKYEWTRLRLKEIARRLESSASPIARRIARLTQSPRPLIRYHRGVDA